MTESCKAAAFGKENSFDDSILHIQDLYDFPVRARQHMSPVSFAVDPASLAVAAVVYKTATSALTASVATVAPPRVGA